VALSNTSWSNLGNAGTVTGTNFIGTTDAIDFVTKTNNAEVMRVASAGNVGIRTTSPTAALHLPCNLRGLCTIACPEIRQV